MSSRRSIIIDAKYKYELEEYYKEQKQIQKEKKEIESFNKEDIEPLLHAIKKERLNGVLKWLCGENFTGDLRADLIIGTFYANVLAHQEKYAFYTVKKKLLEYVVENNIWGTHPYNSYGIGKDEDNNDVIYFDVPNFGQVSFHLVDTSFDVGKVPKYQLKWAGTTRMELPSYKRITKLHDLMFALGCVGYDKFESNGYNGYVRHDEYDEFDEYFDIGTTKEAMNPVNYFELKDDEECTCYFINTDNALDLFYDEQETAKEALISSIDLKAVVFTKKSGIIAFGDITENDMKEKIILEYAGFNESVLDNLERLYIVDQEIPFIQI